MDPAPRRFDELPLDPVLGVPVPFACGTPDMPPPAWTGGPSARSLDHRRVTQCALSRVCGVCGASLGRPLTLVGSADEVGRNAFHFPPSHLRCVEELLAAYAGVETPVLGQPGPVLDWQVVTTGGFEFVRPEGYEEDRRVVFAPNSVITTSPARV